MTHMDMHPDLSRPLKGLGHGDLVRLTYPIEDATRAEVEKKTGRQAQTCFLLSVEALFRVSDSEYSDLSFEVRALRRAGLR